MWELLLIALVLLVFGLPMTPAMIEWVGKRDVRPLRIVQEHEGNAAYFAHQFRAFILGEVRALMSARPTAEPHANYRVIGVGARFVPEDEETTRGEVDRILVGFGDLRLPDGLTFTREVYSRKNIFVGQRVQVRATLAEHRLLFGAESALLRWAHARSIHVGAGSMMLGRLSATSDIFIARGSYFRRVHAPTVRFVASGAPLSAGLEAGEPPVLLDMLTEPDDRYGFDREEPMPATQRTGFRRVILPLDPSDRLVETGDVEFPPNSLFDGDIIVRGSLVIGAGSHIRGNIKAHGDLTIGDGAHIQGSTIAVKRLDIGMDCAIGGPVVSERMIDIGARSRIGALAQPSTVSAPAIRVGPEVVAHGTVWARKLGRSSSPAQA
ncbi:MAG: hypothetical protein HY778_12670 [Betaproteobacteria bacterium]|nr:hypothetical protein [Betaproteobacteria bacterium]